MRIYYSLRVCVCVCERYSMQQSVGTARRDTSSSGAVVVDGLTLDDNNATNQGGGIFVSNTGSLSGSDVTFTANGATTGGGLYLEVR